MLVILLWLDGAASPVVLVAGSAWGKDRPQALVLYVHENGENWINARALV